MSDDQILDQSQIQGDVSEDVIQAQTDDVTDISQASDDDSADDFKSSTTIPYKRFEEVVRKNQDLEERYSGLEKQFKEVAQRLPKEQTPQDNWNDRVQGKDWNSFIPELGEYFISMYENKQKSREKEEAERFESEVSSLYKSGMVKDKDEENAVIKFAVNKGKELGSPIPLKLAAQWLKDTKPQDDAKKEASKKIQSSARSSGVEKDGFSYNRDIRGRSLDDIVFEAKERAPK